MDIHNKNEVNRDGIRPAPEIIEFCRIIAGVLRRTPQCSQVEVESADYEDEVRPDFNKYQA